MCFSGALLVSSSRAHAQPATLKKVAVLYSGSPELDESAHAPFFAELRRAGWIEGRNITYERLFARGSRDKVLELARVAAATRPDLIYAPTAAAASAATKATSSVPVIFATVSDPTLIGLAASLARPGRNATGTFQIQADLVAKKFEMLRETFPKAKRVGVVLERVGSDYLEQMQRHRDAGRQFGLEVSIADFAGFEQVAGALARLKLERVDVITIGSSFTLISNRKAFMDLARQGATPVVGHRVEWAEQGAVMTYGADIGDTLRRTAEIAHRVLKGARPADTPIQQASKFELVVNLRAAKALGIALPKSLVLRADRVIE
jgi:putative tryptophan/tyrosine transport system substrate-binding protein